MRPHWPRLKVVTDSLVTPVFRIRKFPTQTLGLVKARLVVFATRTAPVPLGHGRVVDALKAVHGSHAYCLPLIAAKR